MAPQDTSSTNGSTPEAKDAPEAPAQPTQAAPLNQGTADPNTGEPRNIRVKVKATPRADFSGYGSNIGLYFTSNTEKELYVSRREYAVLKEEGFLAVLVVDSGGQVDGEGNLKDTAGSNPPTASSASSPAPSSSPTGPATPASTSSSVDQLKADLTGNKVATAPADSTPSPLAPPTKPAKSGK